MKKRYVVRLTKAERNNLTSLTRRSREAAYRRRHAEVLLLVDEGKQGPALTDRDAAQRVGFSRRTIEQIRERCATAGLASALGRKPRCRERSRRLDKRGEARLVRLACSPAPEGRARWTLSLLADKLVELEIVERISHECVRQVLKKHDKTLTEADVAHSSAR